jgi:outer membrane protein
VGLSLAAAGAQAQDTGPAAEPLPQNEAAPAAQPAPEGSATFASPSLQATTPPPNAQARTVDLDAALATAQKHAPELRQAAATTQAARARVDIARSPLLPQISGSASYSHGASNGTVAGRSSGFVQRDIFAAGLRGTQLLWDFGQAWNITEAAKDNARAAEHNERTTQLDIAYGVRTAFLTAGANRALVEVAQATLNNQDRHRLQIQGFVEVGTRPPIDLAQAKTDVTTARLELLRAQNNYAAAKAELARSMGVPHDTDFEVSDQLPGAEPEEDAGIDALMKEAQRARPEFAALFAQKEAEANTLRSIKGQYGPTLNFVGSVDETGYNKLSNIATNVGVGVSLAWPIFQGGLTNGRVDEAHALLRQIDAQLEVLQQDLRVSVTQSELALKAAQAALVVADELVQLAKERVTLAEGRYQTGVGNIIELGDAELALRDAQTQRVTAAYDLASARASLHRTLGRP